MHKFSSEDFEKGLENRLEEGPVEDVGRNKSDNFGGEGLVLLYEGSGYLVKSELNTETYWLFEIGENEASTAEGYSELLEEGVAEPELLYNLEGSYEVEELAEEIFDYLNEIE